MLENVLSVGGRRITLGRPYSSKGSLLYGACRKEYANGETSFRRIALANDENAHNMLCELKGIGSWTANVYLVFALRSTRCMATWRYCVNEINSGNIWA